MTPEEREEASQARLDAVLALSPDRFTRWQYFEDRADRLGQRLWSMGTWLLALIGASLALPFIAKFVQPDGLFPYLRIGNRIALALVAAFGVLLCTYAYSAIQDVREHIESNWRKSGHILDGTWQSEWKDRKSHGWNLFMAADAAAFLGFLGLIFLAIHGAPVNTPAVSP